MALMAAVPAVASAALTIDAVNLTRDSGPPGARLIGGVSSGTVSNSTVTVTRTESTALGSIHYAYAGAAGTPDPSVGASGCVNVTTIPGGAMATAIRTVIPVLPRAPGSYELSFQAFSTADCPASGGTRSDVFAAGGVTVTQPAANPHTTLKCGLRVALVLDESSSISDAHVADVQKAANGFVDALSDTGASVGIVAFAQRARVGVPYTDVDEHSIANTFRPFINNGFPATSGRAGTNWDGAFREVDALGAPPPDLVVFVTDGDPNGTNATTTFSTTLDGGADVMTAAVNAADAVKATSRVFAIGVGAALENPASISRLTAVSGPNEFPHHTANFSEADHTSVDFDHLRDSLVSIVAALCGGSLEITKSDFDHDGEFVHAGGWTFKATLHGPPHEWLRPEAGTHPSAHVTTDGHGEALFEWKLKAHGNATVSVVREQSKPGFHLVLARCTVHRPDGSVSERQERTTGPVAEGLVVPPMGWVTCDVHNAGPGAHLRVVKNLVPSSDPGRFDLLVDGIPRIERVGDGGSTPRLLLGFGRHAVSERVTEAQAHVIKLHQYEISTRCVNRATGHVVASGTGHHPVSVRLEHETDDVVCTITNRRTVPPPPHVPRPGRPIIPPAPPVTPPAPPAIPPAVGRAHLVISKRMPARARIGHRVPLRITVRNVGRETAHGAVLHETPIRGGRIVHVAGHRATRHSDGTVTWNLGNLAPRARRTVHATMLVTRRVLLLNRAVADAADTGPAFDDAAVRVTRPPAPPRFTG